MSPYLSLIFHLCNLPPLSFSWWNPMYCSEWYKHKPIHFREILLGSPTAAGAVGTPCGTRVVFTSRSSVSCGVADTPQVLGGSSYWVSGEWGYSQSPTRRGFPFLQTTTIMQQLHCDLQPESQQTNRTTHTWTTTRCRTQWRNRLHTELSAAAPAAHEVPFIAGRRLFTWKNTRFRAAAFPPTQVPCNMHAASTMCFAPSRGKDASL